MSTKSKDVTARIAHHQLRRTNSVFQDVLRAIKAATNLIPPSAIKWVRSVGIVGVVLTAANEAAVMAAPTYYEPAYNLVTEQIGVHKGYSMLSNEPNMAADSQGSLKKRTKFFYDLRVSNLAGSGIVTGRFRGDAQEGIDVDPEWWLVRGYTDGTNASLQYTDSLGNLLGRLDLTTTDKGITWRGYLEGLDNSVDSYVRSPIVIGSTRYDASTRLLNDPHLNESSSKAKRT